MASSEITITEALLKRERGIVLGALAVLSALAWLWLFSRQENMGDNAAAALFVMWTIMMVGMMTPSATPVILLYAALWRRKAEDRSRGAVPPTLAFAAGYLFGWAAFSALAAALQIWLGQAALLSPMMVSASPGLTGAILIVAGAYQWLPVKDACLSHCRSPAHFLSQNWSSTSFGAFRMGLRHGLYCIGCCWALMLVLFAGGVMNLALVAAIAVFVLIEKLAANGNAAGRIAGGALIAGGLYVLASG